MSGSGFPAAISSDSTGSNRGWKAAPTTNIRLVLVKFFGDFDEILKPGDTYSIPANVKHSIEVIEMGKVIDFFVPPRKDYL